MKTADSNPYPAGRHLISEIISRRKYSIIIAQDLVSKTCFSCSSFKLTFQDQNLRRNTNLKQIIIVRVSFCQKVESLGTDAAAAALILTPAETTFSTFLSASAYLCLPLFISRLSCRLMLLSTSSVFH